MEGAEGGGEVGELNVRPGRRRSFDESPPVGGFREEALSERFLRESESDESVGIARISPNDRPEDRGGFGEPAPLRAQVQERSIRGRARRALRDGRSEQVEGPLLFAELPERGSEAV